MKLVKPKNRKENSCKCNACKQMCLRSPCFPTPSEVEKLKAAGYEDKLMPSTYLSPDTLKLYDLIAPIDTGVGCIFLDIRGLCELHEKGLKPLEGRLASHDLPDYGLREWVAKQWGPGRYIH